jgi:hypothetical protein
MIIGNVNDDIQYETIEIDLKGIQSKKDLLYTVSKELNFPMWDENNWDAFNDWLRCIYEPFDQYEAVKIVLKNCGDIEFNVKKIFFEILEDSALGGFRVSNNVYKEVPCYYEIIDECENSINYKIKKTYKEIFNIVREEINKVDPIGVVDDSQLPYVIDEYDMENQEIITIIKKYDDYKELANKICEIFIETTEMKLKPELFYECAKNILEKTKKL